MKWNQANEFIKKPEFIVSLIQTDRSYNSVELYSTKQLNLKVIDWNGTNPNLNLQVFFRKRLKWVHYKTKILPLLTNWEKWWGKKGWDLWKIEVGLQKLRRKPKFFRPYLNYPKVKAFFSSSVFPIHQQRKNFCLIMDPFSAFFWRKPVNLSWDWYPFNLSLTCTANSAVVDSMFHQHYHKSQIDPN